MFDSFWFDLNGFRSRVAGCDMLFLLWIVVMLTDEQLMKISENSKRGIGNWLEGRDYCVYALLTYNKYA